MMWTTKPLFGKGKAVVMGSGVCVLKGLVVMLSHGVYGTTMIKKIYILSQVLQGRFH